MTKAKLVFAVVFSVAIGPALIAQDFPVMYGSPTGGFASDVLMNRQMIEPIVQQVEGTKRNQGQKQASALNDIKPATFSPSASRTRKNLQSFADKTRAVDPAQAEKMEAFFASTDVIRQIGDVMVNFGLSRNNAADAFALYWIATWQAAHGDTSTPSKGAVLAVAAQAARGMSQSPEFAAASDAQKQEMAEALMVQAALIEASVGEAAGDNAQLQAIGKAVKQGASASGLELDTMTLTEEGFREGSPRKRSDASDTGEDEKALAANDTGTDGGGETNYALIAAAAGAGLGGVFLLGKVMGRRG